MSGNLPLLRAIVGDMASAPSLNEPLEAEGAMRQTPEFAFAPRMTGSGERVGIRRTGVAAANKLARSLAKSQPRYRRGTNHRNLTTAIANASIQAFTGRPAASIGTADVSTLEGAVSDWFAANVKPRSYLVPCSIVPDHPPFAHARPFAIGPVAFCHVSDFMKLKEITSGSQNDHNVYGSLRQALSERSATWVAEVAIDGCEETRASEIADLAVDVALAGIQMVVPLNYSRDVARISGRTMPAWISNIHTSGSQINVTIHRRDPGYGLSGEAFDEILSKGAETLESMGRRVNSTFVAMLSFKSWSKLGAMLLIGSMRGWRSPLIQLL